MKRIGIIGSGQVGQVLATGFLKHNYEVMIGSREPSKLEEWKNNNPTGNTGDFNETTDFGDILVLAVKGTVAQAALEQIGADRIGNKIIIDATNPIAEAPPENGVLKFFTTLEDSLMEQLQNAIPQARFVKAFNSVGNAYMVDPDFGGTKPSMFICGNDDEAKSEVNEILEKFGFDVSDMGGAEGARAIEPLCILWCIPGFLRNEWNHAFKLLKA